MAEGYAPHQPGRGDETGLIAPETNPLPTFILKREQLQNDHVSSILRILEILLEAPACVRMS
jgi:hypothetical protein